MSSSHEGRRVLWIRNVCHPTAESCELSTRTEGHTAPSKALGLFSDKAHTAPAAQAILQKNLVCSHYPHQNS